MSDKYFFDSSLLPAGFEYPTAFVELVNADERPTLTPWWLLSIRKESCLFWLDTLRKQYPSRSLIPFAKMGDTDDLACFDGADTSGNPKVFYIHAYTSPGWEQRGEVKDFFSWLIEANEQARRYASRQEPD